MSKPKPNGFSLAFDVDEMVNVSVAENSINPQSIESDIRKKLLPRIFGECKNIGAGMDQAKTIVELIVQITRKLVWGGLGLIWT